MTKYVGQHQSSLATSWSHHLRWSPARYHLKTVSLGLYMLVRKLGRSVCWGGQEWASTLPCCTAFILVKCSSPQFITIHVSLHLCYCSHLWITLFLKLKSSTLCVMTQVSNLFFSCRHFKRFCQCFTHDFSTELCLRSLKKISSSN